LDTLLADAALFHVGRQLERFLAATRAAASVQDRVLQRLVAQGRDSQFGREHGFRQIRGYTDFVRSVPIQSYEDLRPYVEQVIRGRLDALFGPGARVRMFATTSGSVDKPKFIPVTSSFIKGYRRGWNIFGAKALRDHRDAVRRPILQATSAFEEQKTELGIPVGPISGLLAEAQKRVVRRFYASPLEIVRIPNVEARFYTLMRWAVPEDVGWVVTASPAIPLLLARTACDHAERLIRDIRDGTLTPPRGYEDAIITKLRDRLRPDPTSAARLAKLADRHGRLLPRHFWRLSFLANWTGGTLGMHLREFPEYFGETPVRDIGLMATEGRVTIPLEDGTPAGILDCQGAFFEFIEADAQDEYPSGVHRCHQLQAGAEYRVVMTTSAGFYRYDLGDFVRVHGYLGQAPILEFLHRGAYTSSMTGEKLTEWQATEAFARCARSFNFPGTEFVLVPVWNQPPFYRLCLECPAAPPDGFVQSFDEHVKNLNCEYAVKRASGRLGPVRGHTLPVGTLAKMDAQRMATHGSSREQYKRQLLYTSPQEATADDILESATLVENRPGIMMNVM
jgi:hypothetical protein